MTCSLYNSGFVNNSKLKASGGVDTLALVTQSAADRRTVLGRFFLIKNEIIIAYGSIASFLVNVWNNKTDVLSFFA